MLDIKFIVENKDLVAEGLVKKGYTNINIDDLISLHSSINKLKTSSQALAEEKNRLSNNIKTANAEERPAIIAKSKEIGEDLKKEQEELAIEIEKFDNIMLRMPNLPSNDSPVGKDDTCNVVRRKVGDLPKFSFQKGSRFQSPSDWMRAESSRPCR